MFENNSYSTKSSLSDSRTDVLRSDSIAWSKQVTRRTKISCRTCVSATFAVVAVLALLILAGVIVTVILRLHNFKAESNTEVVSLKQEMESLKDQQVNITNELTKLIQMQQSEMESLKYNLQR